MKEEMWEVIKIKLEKTLENYEIDKKIGQLTTDSLCTLFPTEMQVIIDYINNLQSQLKAKEEVIKEARKFINKIKGDSEDKVKELLEHIEILDNTDYILHSDKAKALLDYITNLQQKVEQLENIRKEAREYIKEHTELAPYNEDGEGGGLLLCDYDVANVLEILSKGENK